jgi:hypothetical protein
MSSDVRTWPLTGQPVLPGSWLLQVKPRERPEETDGMLEIVPRARRAVGFLQFPNDLRHGLDVIGDLTDTEVVAALAGLMQVLAERALQLQEPVVVAANLDQGPMPVLDLVENAHQRGLELSQIYGERPRLYLHGGIVALVPAAGRIPRFTQDFSISLLPANGFHVQGRRS